MNPLRDSPAVRRHVAATVCCGVVVAACALAAAVLTAHLAAGIITYPATRTPARWAPQLAVLAVLWAVRGGAQWVQARLGQRGATAVIADLDRRVLTGVTGLPPRRLADVHDDAAVLVTRGIDAVRPYFTRFLPAVVLAALVTPAAVVLMACYDPRSALVVVIALPLIPVFMILIGMVTKERSAASLAAMGTLQARLLDLVAGIPTLRGVGRAAGAAPRIAELGRAHRRSAMATLRIAFLSSFVLELLATLGVALVAVGVGLRLVFGEVALADALTALLLAPEAFWPLRRVGVEFHAAQDGKTAAAAARALLDELPAPAGGAATVTAHGAPIVLAGVTVASRDGAAPHDLSAVAAPGEVTVLTGPNGAGKSTALQAILGLVAPTAGRVTVGGIDVSTLDLDRWWTSVAWLAQRPVLVPGTVRDNLETFGPLTDLDAACAASGFDDVLATLPEGCDTVLGRGGTGLSLGQRQRLGLARALGSPAPVLLLDEPTSHLDAETETRVLEAIRRRAAAGATVVVVAHRAAVLAIADRVIDVVGSRGPVAETEGASLVHP